MVSLSSQGAKSQRGEGWGVKNASFHISRDSVPNPALVPGSSLYCDIDKCSTKDCGKFHQD